MTDICCIGHITQDRIITVNPRRTTFCAGGSAYYMAWALQHLPHDIDFRLITCVSREMNLEIGKMREAGINVTAYESETNVCFENYYAGDTDNREQRVLARSTPFTSQQMEGEDARVFHLGTLLADDFTPETLAYLATKGEISIDAQGFLRKVDDQQVVATDWTDKHHLLKHISILKVNKQESFALTGYPDPYTAAEQIHDWGATEVIITLGSSGSIILAEDKFYKIAAYAPKKTIDATGCGDTYCAGYLYARIRGMDYIERGRFAAAMCALKLEHNGPFDHTIDDIRQIIGTG